MRAVRSSWFPFLLGLIIIVVISIDLFSGGNHQPILESIHRSFNETGEWVPPDPNDIPPGKAGDSIRYGMDLIVHTAQYLGPKGIVSQISNGMNCQNCHLSCGTIAFANPFSAVASTYPKFRERSGRIETIEWRINECMERSLNGHKLDTASYEMKAMVAYLKWIGSGVPKGIKPKGSATEMLPYLSRPADTAKGRQVYISRCKRCHGINGEGLLQDSGSYTYPPLWNNHSYNVSAGMYTLSRLAGFIKNNMPYGTVTWKNPELTNEESWDVAAFINTQPRPEKFFVYDWPDVSKKPVDFPFGPYSDSFSQWQHKYGPFEPIKKKKGKG